MDSQHILEMIEPKTLDKMVSRRAAVRAGMLAMAATGTVPMMIAAMARTAFAQASPSVIDVLNFALKLEYLESEFYNIATGVTPLPSAYTGSVSVIGTTSTPTAVFTEIAKHETAHVADLQAAITANSGTPVAKPTFDFTGGSGAMVAGKYVGPFLDVFSNPTTFLALSQAFEDTGVRAYKGGAPLLVSNVGALESALQIHSVEARHASKVRRLRGEKGWITGHSNTLPAQAQAVYGPGNPASSYPDENNTTQGGVVVTTLPGVMTNAATEAFDEPLDMATVLSIAGLFIKAS